MAEEQRAALPLDDRGWPRFEVCPADDCESTDDLMVQECAPGWTWMYTGGCGHWGFVSKEVQGDGPQEGACPRCRKLVPLVPGDQGSFVLRTHHVVIAGEAYHGHGVEECAGSGGEPAALDDSEDWAWVPEEPETAPAPSADNDRIESSSEVLRGGRRLSPSDPAPIGDVISETLARQIRAVAADDVLDTAHWTRVRDALQGVGEAAREAVAGIIDEERTLTAEQMAQIMRFTADGGPRVADMTFVRDPGAFTRAVLDDIQPANFTGVILEAIRQAWIDETGAPPRDATVTLSEHDLMRDMQTMDIVFEPYQLYVSIPIYGNAPDIPGFAEAAGREAAETVRRALRERLETRCTAVNMLHECDQPAGPHEHRCRICNWRWRDAVAPTLNAGGG